MMKKTLVLAMAMVLGVTASVYAANPFSDWQQPELLMVMAMVILAANV